MPPPALSAALPAAPRRIRPAHTADEGPSSATLPAPSSLAPVTPALTATGAPSPGGSTPPALG
eukprot:12213541-Alexandrium_andersonii.AAC.1